MTREQLINVFKQIVINTAYSDTLQPNGFAVFDFPPNWGSPSLGYEFQDFVDGNLWFRQWVGNGASKNDFCAEYPLVLLEQKTNVAEDYDSDAMVCKFHIVVIDKIKCENCPDHIRRTDSTVLNFTLQMLRNLLKEFVKVNCYQWEEGAEIKQTWLTPEFLSVLQAANKIPSDVEEVDKIENSLCAPDEGVMFWEWGEGLKIKYGLVAHSVSLEFSKCEPTEPNMNYSADEFEAVGITNCKSC